MPDIDSFQDDAESKVGEFIQNIADFVADKKKALAGGVVSTAVVSLTAWLGADSPVTIAVVGLATTLGVFAGPANQAFRKLARKGPSKRSRAAAAQVPADRVAEIERRHAPTV